MDVASVSFSRPYFVNAPLVADANNSNTQEVQHNITWSNSLLDSILCTIPKMFVEDHSFDYYRQLPHYFDIVRYHIDVTIIRNRLKRSTYYCVQDLVNDIERMWNNILIYFPTSDQEYSEYLSKWNSCQSLIEEKAKDVSTSFKICPEHCIFCGATSYPKYPLIECRGKCGRRSHLHCGSILDGSWTCCVCAGRIPQTAQKNRSILRMLCSFKEWTAKHKPVSLFSVC